ncbi:RUN and FYVE domain containing protein 4 [Dissostichus eleginoides]|uniref:RUN and FYVE domain containing protein 4 n=1 Tax=Dissostichus eleginoides TaxID=100907 RepID=A0AAD9BGY6_DISEL|nr:RUN and FYVE domain containing protein 4 [Dissostichus eleginoides]
MAPKDPLLGTLKVCVLSLQSEGGLVTDNSPHLASCCELLELLLRKGLQQPVLSLLNHKDACGRLSSLSLVLEQTRVCRKLLSAQGRGRFLLRLALHRRVLPQLLTHLLHTPRVLEWYSPEVSILRNEAFLAFMSLLLVLANMDFKLDMENCSFLDESWILPVCEKYEVVPCREVGLVLRYLSGRVFVLDLTPGGQAHVDNFIRPGDIIDEINGTSLRNSKNGQAGVVLSRLKGLPLSIGVLRWRAGDGTVFRPLVKLLRNLKTENPSLQLGPQAEPHTEPEEQNPSQCLKDGRIVYIVQFLGKANIGMHGGKEVLQHAITQVLQKNQQSKEVLLDLKETHLTCTDRDSKQELLEHHYPEISCVGRYGQPDYTVFAFCVADSPETPLSTGFCCVAFRAQSIRECEDMVCRIATGFKHTEWFV